MTDFTPRPTVYKGIKMRSRLEASFAQYIDNNFSGPWRYEPECFADESGQYLPDFLVGDNWFIEVKPPVADLASASTLTWADEYFQVREPVDGVTEVLWYASGGNGRQIDVTRGGNNNTTRVTYDASGGNHATEVS